MNLRLFALIAAVCVSIANFGVLAAEEVPAPASAKAEKVQAEDKQLQGQISAISSDFIAVVYGTDSEVGSALEAAFSFDKNVRVIHKKSVKQLQVGDTVTVSYRLTKEKLESGRILQKKIVSSIAFVKAAPKGLISQETATVAPQEAQPLALKGIKGEAGNE